MTAMPKAISPAQQRGRDWDVMWERYGITAVLLAICVGTGQRTEAAGPVTIWLEKM